ncbi:MAG: methyl-accepting chemotaxis protein [Porticoccaceae bacterium]|nr:chemotaxis protein [Pseudomonadales bacterium]MCP5173069.1 chemotaxis protein [Pseudomonadales bacterium]MCP5302543.1 chemotaxis protein [Pseudomonadales bacterium]
MKKGTQRSKTSFSIALLFVLLAVVVAFLAYNLQTVFQKTADDQDSLQLASEIRAASYRLMGLSREATAGQEESFAELQAVVDGIQVDWKALNESVKLEMPVDRLAELDVIWSRLKSSAETLIADKETVIFLNQVAAQLNETLPQLQQEHTQVVEILLENNAPADQVAVAQAQSWRAERIGRNIDKMLAGGDDSEASADQFNRDANLFGRVLAGMRSGDVALGISRITNRNAKTSLDSITSRFEFVNSSIKEIFEATPALFAARQANEAILNDSPIFQEKISQLADAIALLPQQRELTNQTALIAGGVAIGLLALIGLLVYAGTRRSLRETAETNERSQQAILRLLDEIGDLGDGDLTAHATVSEDFTGAIADSINYAIDQLRILVKQIQEASSNVFAAANETRTTAEQLTESAQHQAQEIAGASAAINEMAITIDQVSSNAAESAVVADRSVSIAKTGAEVVQNTIGGMDTIREQIQDTSKRIKRLGESSQEIGDIVSLINDIADQTNILALNAAIQASMAGDAGRGFAVVADEVQRLAERSAGATKQIASLVKTIQTDTNEAVSSMEQTTSEVVKGAARAQDAGVALEEIETVSANLAELIQDISTTASHQATTAGHISGTMNVIQDITSQTLAGTSNTARNVGELAELAVELRNSVSGFRLPDGLITPVSESSAGSTVKDLAEPESLTSELAEVERADTAANEQTLEDDELLNLDDEGSGKVAASTVSDELLDFDDHLIDMEDEDMEEKTSVSASMDSLADELMSEEGSWDSSVEASDFEKQTDQEFAGVIDFESDTAEEGDNFTIDVDELDLSEIEAELGLTDEDLGEDVDEKEKTDSLV